MRKTFLRLGSFFMFAAVALGAFGAHGLKTHLSPESFAVFETGVRYHFYHAIGLVILGVLMHHRKTQASIAAGWLFVAGIILFSGSLYLLSVSDTMNINLRWLGPITPIGGVLFLMGWGMLFFSTYQKNLYSKG